MTEDKTDLEVLETDELYVAKVEKWTLAFPRIMEVAVKNTIQEDWIDFGGNAWLKTPGAERIARAFGFTIKEVRKEREDRQDEKGKYYLYVFYGKVGLQKYGMFIDAIGTCSSRKPFHFIDHDRERAVSEVKEENILKDAYSNLLENGVTRFLGLRGLPWHVLAQYGISKDKATKVDFKTKGSKKSPPKSSPGKNLTPEQMKEKLTEDIVQACLARSQIKREEVESLLPEHLKVNQLKGILESVRAFTTGLKSDDLLSAVKAIIYTGGE